ncbi:major facilitator family protein transporter [Mycolicibacterium smegmatis MKD8]|uniref:Major facilitator family protein transporter n=1 Tax=Mycolicibacterium smegmatis (strain MKD8) TaxID=1214915 RepID=A0A2U9PNT4_MYCSE|nr:major facilitator family protein transporter [Mycolicibacterium smegmatis MKD8]
MGVASEVLDRLPVTRWHWRLVFLVGIGTFFDLYEVFLGGVLAPVMAAQYELGDLGKAMVIAAGFAGMFVGANVLSVAADRFGRRRVFILNMVLYAVFSLASAFAPDPEIFVILRFLSGIGLGAELVLVDSYLAEMLPARARGRMTAWAYTIGFLGVPIAALLGGRFVARHEILGIDGWRWLLILGGLAAVFVLAVRSMLPESPRWLEIRGRHAEARVVVESIVEAVGADVGPLDVIPDGRGGASRHGEDEVRRVTDVLRIAFRDYRSRSVMLIIFQVLQTVAYFGFGTLAPLVLVHKGFHVTESLAYSALSFAGYPLGSLVSVPLVERFERKHLIIASALAIAVFGVVFAAASSVAVIVAAGFLLTAVSNVFCNAFHIYQAEIFPTAIRSTASGAAYSLSRAASAVLPFIAVPLLTAFGPVVVFAGSAVLIVLLCVDVAVLGPRSTGLDLETVQQPVGVAPYR